MTPEELLNEVGEPVAYFSDEFFSINTKQNATFNDPLFSSDQVAAAILKATGPLEDQLATAEQRVAEACALQVATETKFHWLDAARVAKEIRSGEWRKFVKEV